MLIFRRSQSARGNSSRGGRPWIAALVLLPLIAPFVLINLNCSNDKTPTQTHGDELNAIAGGGRGVDDDPFAGGPDGSGPNEAVPGGPDFDGSGGLRPIAYLGNACGDAPATVVLADSAAWRVWWEANVGCDEVGGMPMPGGMGNADGTCPPGGMRGHSHGGHFDGMPGDSGWVDPDSTRPWELPVIDFATGVVIAITLERAAGDPRMLVVEEVAGSESGTTIRYAVYRPDDDCGPMRPDSSGSNEFAPAIAVLVPLPAGAPFTWERRDTTYSCSWEPDPNQPLMLYYTDAPCELGTSETILTDQDHLDAWVDQALACDMARWDVVYDSLFEPGDSGWAPGGGNPSAPPIPPDFTIPVDFGRFAVIVLRAGDQERWGGGIWLTEFATSGEGTRIGYTVVAPGAECPLVSDSGLGAVVNPTVAIRVPLPLPEPVRWLRDVRTVDCNWGSDGDSVIIGWDSTGVRPPGGR